MTHQDRTQVPSAPTEKSLPPKKGTLNFSLGFIHLSTVCNCFGSENLRMFLRDWEKTFWKLHFDTANFNTTWKYGCVQSWFLCFLGFNLFPTRQRGLPEGEQINHGHCAGPHDVCYLRRLIVILFDLTFFHFHVDIYVCAYIHTYTYMCIFGKI